MDKARRELGFQPRFSNREALLRNYEWYLAAGLATQPGHGESGVSHRLPWKHGLLRVVKAFF